MKLSDENMERGFENRGVVSGLMGDLGEGCGCRIVGQDKASTVSHGALLRFRRLLLSFSHRARTVRTVRTPLAKSPRFASVGASIRTLPKLLSCAAASTILIAALGFVARKLGLVITLTDSSCSTVNPPPDSQVRRAIHWSKGTSRRDHKPRN